MDRLKFIYRALNVIAAEQQDPVTEYLLVVAIRREIEIVREGPAVNVPLIERCLVQTRAIAV